MLIFFYTMTVPVNDRSSRFYEKNKKYVFYEEAVFKMNNKRTT